MYVHLMLIDKILWVVVEDDIDPFVLENIGDGIETIKLPNNWDDEET